MFILCSLWVLTNPLTNPTSLYKPKFASYNANFKSRFMVLRVFFIMNGSNSPTEGVFSGLTFIFGKFLLDFPKIKIMMKKDFLIFILEICK